MLRHIVAWNIKEDLSEKEKEETKKMIRLELEALVELVPTLKEMKVYTNELVSGTNREIMLSSLFEDEAGLDEYMVHPEHKRVVKLIHHLLQDRVVLDYTERG